MSPRRSSASASASSSTSAYEAVCRSMLRKRGVSQNADRGFGRGALTTKGKIFAMLSSRGEFVVKLPGHRVAALVASGSGRPFASGPGRVMREWLRVPAAEHWEERAEEARRFVAQTGA